MNTHRPATPTRISARAPRAAALTALAAGLTACAPTLDADAQRRDAATLIAQRTHEPADATHTHWADDARAPRPDLPDTTPAPDTTSPFSPPTSTTSPSTTAPHDPAQAPLWDGRAPLAPRQAARTAIARSPRVREALARLDAARAQFVQAGLLPNPVVGVALQIPLGESGGVPGVSASLAQQLAALLTRGPRVDAARAEMAAAVLQLAEEAVAAAAHAHRLHARARAAARAVEGADQLDAALRRALDALQRQVAAGQQPPDALADAHARHAAARARRAALLAEHDDARAHLAALLGHAPAHGSPGPTLIDDPTAPTPPPPPTPDAEHTPAQAPHRLDVLIAAAVLDARRAQARAAGVGELSAGPEFERDTDAEHTLGPALQAELPLFDDGRAARALARAHVREAQARLDALAAQAAADQRVADARLTAARLELDAARETLDAARRARDLVAAALTAGQADALRLALADARAAEAALALEEAAGRLRAATIDQAVARGTPIP